MERAVKIVTVTASKIFGNGGGDSFIRAKLQAKKKDAKIHFKEGLRNL